MHTLAYWEIQPFFFSSLHPRLGVKPWEMAMVFRQVPTVKDRLNTFKKRLPGTSFLFTCSSVAIGFASASQDCPLTVFQEQQPNFRLSMRN